MTNVISKSDITIGTQFFSHGKHPKLCTVTDILTTYNSQGNLVMTRYVAEHEFCGQTIVNRDVCAVTIQRGYVERS